MSGALVHSVEVAIVRCAGDGDQSEQVERPTVVRYCDICRRWGASGTTHMCWRNWHKRLSGLLIELAREGRR